MAVRTQTMVQLNEQLLGDLDRRAARDRTFDRDVPSPRRGRESGRIRAVVCRGGVYLMEHPAWGRRPVLVLTRQAAIPVLKQVTVASISSQIRGIPTEVVLDEQNGMARRRAVSLDNLGEVSQALLIDHLTTLDEGRMGEVCHALNIAVSC